MVAKITVPRTINRALNYNEQKVKEGKAECLLANGFLKEAAQLNFYEKLDRFERLNQLNKRAATNTMHISLNFAVQEKLQSEKLVEIATTYMDKIGFGEQPYLVYLHTDAGHPHIHIITTTIKPDGKRISIHNIGRNASAKARREIENEFKLVKAEEQPGTREAVRPVDVQKVIYGRSATKRAISNVLTAVIPHYKYGSLAELNAILKLYNVVADRGREEGVMFRKKGLQYRVLDEKGNKTGVPIKASSFFNQPTLAYLEKKFIENAEQKKNLKKNCITSINWIMLKPPKDIIALKEALQKEKISLVVRQNEKGFIYGLTFIDHTTKAVFNGSELGKQYSAKNILDKCGIQQTESNEKSIAPIQKENLAIEEMKQPGQNPDGPGILGELIRPKEQFNYLPYDLRKRKRKKKRS